MAKSGFQVGDRVRLRRSIHIVRAGTLGTVLGVQLAWGRDLERADEHERTTVGG